MLSERPTVDLYAAITVGLVRFGSASGEPPLVILATTSSLRSIAASSKSTQLTHRHSPTRAHLHTQSPLAPMPALPSFMLLPTEVRLIVYDLCVSDHQRIYHRRQPTNAHYTLLRICAQITREAAPIVFSYVSLSNERQIRSFIASAGDHLLSRIASADVANDGRLVKPSSAASTGGKFRLFSPSNTS